MLLYYYTLENIVDDEVALRDDNKQRDVRPREERKLAHVVALFEGEHEPHEPDDVHQERDEAVVAQEEVQEHLGGEKRNKCSI